jgi:ferrous-iron efflux pump FieF
LGQSLFILISAAVIGWAAILRLMTAQPQKLQAETNGILAMLASIVLTLALIWWQTRVARQTGNKVVKADRLHYLGDLLPNLGAIASLWASSRFSLIQIDSVMALAAAGMLALGALKIGRGAWDALMDRTADPEIIEGIATLAREWDGVQGFHDLKTRMAGSRIFVHLHIELDGDLSLREAHDIGAGLRRTILLAYPQADVIIHKDVAHPNPAKTTSPLRFKKTPFICLKISRGLGQRPDGPKGKKTNRLPQAVRFQRSEQSLRL